MFFGFGKPNIEGVLRAENGSMKKQIRRVEMERARIKDMSSGIAAGIKVKGVEGLEGNIRQLRVQTAYKENLALQGKILRAENEVQAECQRIEEENEIMRQKLLEPLTLTLTSPFDSQVIKRNNELIVSWTATGPIGDRVRIGLMKNHNYITTISYGVKTAQGQLLPSWKVPQTLPPGKDYQISIQDPTSGLTQISQPFEITQ